MPGGYLQLAAYGSQDFYLTGNPQISFLKQFTVDILILPWIMLGLTQMEI